MRVPVRAAWVAHVHVADVIFAVVDEEVIRDDDTGHGTEKDAPAAENRDEGAWVSMIHSKSAIINTPSSWT